MSDAGAQLCRDDSERRKLTRAAPLHGLDYLEVNERQTELSVFFLGKAPELEPRNLRIEGGVRVRDVRVVSLRIERDPREERDDRMIVRVDRPGDASQYCLRVVALDAAGRALPQPPSDFDPRYASLSFSFRASCADGLDCAAGPLCPAPIPSEPEIDYLAKDYASFRQLLLDRLSLLVPDYRERHAPDLGVTLVELLAYRADQLSYHQDAVATEAYLDSARLRTSVRRHLRLIDYALHEGCNARSWIALSVSSQVELEAGDYFASAIAGAAGTVLEHDELPAETRPWVFEPIFPPAGPRALRPARNAIRFHSWNGRECCLPAGATRATLIDPGSQGHELALKRCDVLVFEELRGPHTGRPEDADPAHRHAVRLTRATRDRDPLPDANGRQTRIWEIEWSVADALPFPLCISAAPGAPLCEPITDVSVARGNVVLADHGRSVQDVLGQVPRVRSEQVCASACAPAERRDVPGRFRPELSRTELTFRQAPPVCPGALDACSGEPRVPPARDALRQDAREAVACIALTSIPAAPDGQPAFSLADLRDPSELARAIAQPAAAPVQSRTAAARPASAREWLRRQLPRGVQSALDVWHAQPEPAPLPAPLRARVRALLQSLLQAWQVRADLLASGPDDPHFVVEVDDERRAQLRFGDGACGRLPPAGALFVADYRVGNGSAGNSGSDALVQLVTRGRKLSGVEIAVRNPLPASGGQDHESVNEARLRGPHQLRARLERAITAADYAAIAMRDFPDEVQRAAATLRWNGHGQEVLVAIDARAGQRDAAGLHCRIARHLARFARIGHDLRVEPARLVAVDLTLTLCVAPGYHFGHVKAAVLAALSARALPDGRLGFFHPDRSSFGQGLFLSQIVAVVQALPGVAGVHVDQLERSFAGANGELAQGMLALGPLEVVQLDDDPSFPERGRLRLREGGR